MHTNRIHTDAIAIQILLHATHCISWSVLQSKDTKRKDAIFSHFSQYSYPNIMCPPKQYCIRQYFRGFGLSAEIRKGLISWFSDVFIIRHIYWSGNFREVWLAKFAKRTMYTVVSHPSIHLQMPTHSASKSELWLYMYIQIMEIFTSNVYMHQKTHLNSLCILWFPKNDFYAIKSEYKILGYDSPLLTFCT